MHEFSEGPFGVLAKSPWSRACALSVAQESRDPEEGILP